MKYFKNVPETVESLGSMISIQRHQVVSMGLSKSEHCDIRLFAFADGEEVTQEIYPMDTMYLCIEGSMIIKKENETVVLQSGECITIAQGISHSVHSNGDFKMLQIMLGE